MPRYLSTESPVTEELIQAIYDDFNRHLESRLQQVRDYMLRRLRERIKELSKSTDNCSLIGTHGEELELRRKKKAQPIIPNWRVPGGQYSPDEREDMLRRTASD